MKHTPLFAAVALLVPASLAAVFVACSSSSTSTPVGTGDDAGDTATDAAASIVDVGAPIPIPDLDAGPDLLTGCARDPGPIPPAFAATSKKDPLAGAFTLDQATAGFPAGTGTWTAAIYTELKGIKCTLDDKAAPISVANFIGLARGTRPYKQKTTWQIGRFYDGLTWHRVIPDFVIQGGDPLGDGTGGPGFDLTAENHIAEPKGTLAMAAGAKPSGSQFYVVVGMGPSADYNVFGTCDTPAAIAVANVPRDIEGGTDMPLSPVHMLRVEIGRCP